MKTHPQHLRRGSDTVMNLDVTRLLLAFKESKNVDDLSSALQGLGLELEDGASHEGDVPPGGRINHTDRRFWIRARIEIIDEQLYDAIEENSETNWSGLVRSIGYPAHRG